MAQIFTTLGMMDESLLTKTEGSTENENVSWQEWVFEGNIVKREVQMHLKQGLFSAAIAKI